MFFKLFVIVLVNIPILSYLFESFLHGKDVQENLTSSFGLLLIAIYSFQSLIILSLVCRKIDIKQSFVLINLLLILAFIGIFNSNSAFYTCIVLIKYINLILFSMWLTYQSISKIKLFITYGYYGSFWGFVLFAILHYYLSAGDFLFTLAQIQLPAFFLLYLFTYSTCKFDARVKVYYHITAISYLIILILGGFKAFELEQFRFQYLPIALFMVIIFLMLPINILISVAVIFTANLIYNTADFVEILLYRLGSFEERLAILHVMAIDSFYFMVPQGLGASDKLFDINSFTEYASSERRLYPPHSGFASMLYDCSVFFFLFVTLFYINLFRAIKVNISEHKSINYLGITRIPFLLIFVVIYFFENIFYLKYTVAGATFSDDSLFIFVSMCIFYYKIKIIGRAF